MTGWDDHTRMQNLYRVVDLSRFLICPEVCCKNLASSIRPGLRMPPMWWKHLWARTTMELVFGRWDFMIVGAPKDRDDTCPQRMRSSPRKIFAQEWDSTWRTHLGGCGHVSTTGAKAELGDRCRTARLVENARLMASAKRDSATIQGYSGFFAKVDELGLSKEDLHAPHLQRANANVGDGPVLSRMGPTSRSRPEPIPRRSLEKIKPVPKPTGFICMQRLS